MQDRLLKYVYSGFLESVLGPALHQVRRVSVCVFRLLPEGFFLNTALQFSSICFLTFLGPYNG